MADLDGLDNLVHCSVCGSMCVSGDGSAVVCWDCEDYYFLNHVIVIAEEA